MGKAISHQLTLGSCKLSVDVALSQPVLEFTDYSTDITWLSGRAFLVAAGTEGSRLSRISIRYATIDVTRDSIMLSGNNDSIDVGLHFTLIDAPVRLDLSVSLSKPVRCPDDYLVFRLGPTWTPPESWWKYWSYWRMVKLTDKTDQSDEPPGLTGEKLGSVLERLAKDGRHIAGMPATADEEVDATAWIFSDERRFLIMLREPGDERAICPLDLLLHHRPPTFIMGGVGPNESRASTVFIPGKGGWAEAFDAYCRYLGSEG